MSWISDRLIEALHASFSEADHIVAARSVADTIAVAAAGYCTASVERVSAAYQSPFAGEFLSWDGSPRSTHEEVALLDAMAAHALDYDDIDATSSAHLSCVVVPAILAGNPGIDESSLLDAVLAATLAAGHISTWLGSEHYRRGWHATSTIGALAATVALARIRDLPIDRFESALAIACSQLGGLQANFGSDTKALHAGFAASAACRAVHLSDLGITGRADILSHPNLTENFGTVRAPDPGAFRPSPPLIERQLLKLYPCCFALHRAVDAAIEAGHELGERRADPTVAFKLSLPKAAFDILLDGPPRSGVEAAFSAAYCCAAAVLDGTVAIHHFVDGFPDERIMERAARFIVTMNDRPTGGAGVAAGEINLTVESGGKRSASYVRTIVPGSYLDSDRDHALRTKASECLERFRKHAGEEFPLLGRLTGFQRVQGLLH